MRSRDFALLITAFGFVLDREDGSHRSAFGDTLEEAMAESRIALAAWLDAMEDHRLPIPEPRYRQAKAA